MSSTKIEASSIHNEESNEHIPQQANNQETAHQEEDNIKTEETTQDVEEATQDVEETTQDVPTESIRTEPSLDLIEMIKDEDQMTDITEMSGLISNATEIIQAPVLAEDTNEDNFGLVHTFSSNYFLYKHTPSFKCLEQYMCSRSDLRLTLHFFPPLTDPGLDDALNYIPPEEEPDPNGTDKYIKMCKDLTIVPISRVIRSLATDTLDLKYYGITLQQMRGIADALKVNSNIKYLIFQDNWMSPEATNLISEILRESNSIRVLNLKECRIGIEGAEKLCEGIASTQFLQELDLSFNSLGDKGLKILQASIIENTSLKTLNISHNELTEESGQTLEQILLENKMLEQLDLSWNGFYTGPGNKKLCNGLIKNELIQWLSLAWNGIGTTTSIRPITKYLKKTKVLQFLDISWNRITQQALRLVRGALLKNKSLREVKIGNNIYTPDEAYLLASLFTKVKTDNLRLLDMEDMCVNKDFLQMRNQCLRKRRIVTHGHIMSNYKINGPDIPKLLFARCKYLAMKPKKKKQKKDFGHFVLSLPDNPITAQDFQAVLKKMKVKKIDKDLLNELMSRFSTKGKKIDCVTMKEVFMRLYPDTVLPEEKKKKKKKKKGKKGKTGKKKNK